MGSTSSQTTDWCCQKVQLSRESSQRNIQLQNIDQQIQRTLKKINVKPLQKRSDENSLGDLNSQFSHNTQLFNIMGEVELEKSNVCRCRFQKFTKTSAQAQSMKLQVPSNATKRSEQPSNANEDQTENRIPCSQLLTDNNTNRSQNSQSSSQIQSNLKAFKNKVSSKLQPHPSMVILKSLRSISIEEPRAQTSRNYQLQNSQIFKISQQAFMVSNVEKNKRIKHKPIFQYKKPTQKRLKHKNLQIESRVSDSQRQTIQLQNGDTFDGLVAESEEFQGQGIYQMSNGSVYRGAFREGKAHGLGTYRGADGFHYEGQWVDNAPHGYGKAKYNDQSTYAGYFKRGKRHGKGYFSRGKISYNGNFVEDRMEGYGVYHTQTQIYQGEWLNNLKHGKGLHKLANGDIYQGQFEHDEKQGYGVTRYTNESTYSGFWSKGKMDTRKRKPYKGRML